jgi:hypothetical protein
MHNKLNNRTRLINVEEKFVGEGVLCPNVATVVRGGSDRVEDTY